MRVAALFILIVFSLSGCGINVEYQNVYSACSDKGYKKFPQKIREYKCTYTEEIEVLTGERECVKEILDDGKKFRSACKNLTRIEEKEYEKTCTEDINSLHRSDLIWECTRNTCMEKYGNTGCDLNPARPVTPSKIDAP